jgi:hypothetical protein
MLQVAFTLLFKYSISCAHIDGSSGLKKSWKVCVVSGCGTTAAKATDPNGRRNTVLPATTFASSTNAAAMMLSAPGA